ncbi:MAG TPA: hypothetical protein VGK29_10950 [Paludibaculum sp.]
MQPNVALEMAARQTDGWGPATGEETPAMGGRRWLVALQASVTGEGPVAARPGWAD